MANQSNANEPVITFWKGITDANGKPALEQVTTDSAIKGTQYTLASSRKRSLAEALYNHLQSNKVKCVFSKFEYRNGDMGYSVRIQENARSASDLTALLGLVVED